MLDDRKVAANPHLMGALDEFLGAVYALIFAKQLGFVDRTRRSIEVDKVQKRAREIADGHVRTDGKWMAGFHFNSAILRLAAAYHRVLKVVTGDPMGDAKLDSLRKKASALHASWTNQAWSRQSLDKIHAEVNHLKHSSKGTFYGRTVKYSHAIESVGELLDILEAWGGRRKQN